MSFRQLIVELHGTQRRGARFGHELVLRSETVAAHQGVGIRQAGIGAGVVGVFGYGLLKIFDRPLETRRCPLVPEVAAFEIQIICLIRIWSERSLMSGVNPLVVAESELNSVCNLLRNLTLKSQQVDQFPIVLPRPHMRLVSHLI